MIIGDLTPEFVFISLILKCVFLIIVGYELALPRLNPPEERLSLSVIWKTDLSAELQHAAIAGISFLFSIGLLLGLDYIASDDSWLPFVCTITLDLLLIGLILALLYSPKTYAITREGIYHQGLVLKWGLIKTVDHSTTTRLKVKTSDWYRDNPEFPLPKDRETRSMIIDRIEEGLKGTNGEKASDGPGTPEGSDPSDNPANEERSGDPEDASGTK
jgi:hypothetical protein